MSDKPKIILPFDNHTPKSDEMAYNATQWAKAAKIQLPKSVGFIFVFFPKVATGQGKGVVVANVQTEAMKDELKAVLRLWGEQRKIIIPGDGN